MKPIDVSPDGKRFAGGSDKPERLLLLNHDIRSAVADMLGGLDLIDDSGLGRTSITQLERVRASAEALDRLIGEMLLEVTGEPEFTLALADDSRIALVDLLRTVQRRWSGHAQMQGLALSSDIADDLPVLIEADGTALERILSNLLSNAFKYAESGTITLRVDLGPDSALRFVIEDEGPGFSDAALARLFEFRGRPADALRPGTGMGLHICKDLADSMGGRLEVSNAPERGARVSLILPPAAWKRPEEGAGTGGLPDLTGLRVLVAEDNPTNQLILAQMLTHMKASPTIVSDGRAALDALTEGDYDIALVDIEMPQLSGIEVITGLRALPGPRGRIPVLAVTAYVLRAYRDEIYRAGADGMLAKPVRSVIAFGEAVSSLMRKARQKHEGQPPPRVSVKDADVTRIDQERFRQLLNVAGDDGREELLMRLDFDLSRARSGLQAGIAARDYARIRAETHILISLAGAVGADGLLDVVGRINDAAHRSGGDEIAAMQPIAMSGLDRLIAEIRQMRHAMQGEEPR